jgi:hypothetical protein
VLLAAGAALYLMILFCASLPNAIKQKQAAYLLGVPAAIATMHFSWGIGFWYSILTLQR